MWRWPVRAVRALPLFLLFASQAFAQTPPTVGIRDNTPNIHALTNARIVQGPGRVIDRGTVIIRDGVIEAVGAKVSIPSDARVWDYDGLTVYPGLIDLYSHIGLTKKKSDDESKDTSGASYWNENITPERNVMESFGASAKDMEKMRSLGFTCAVVVPDAGAIGGSAALINLADGNLNDQLIAEHTTQCMSLVHASPGYNNPKYPTSLMGRITLIRQAILDAQWYTAAQAAYKANPAQTRPESNDALEALAAYLATDRPMMCAVDNDFNLLRAQKIAREFDLSMWIRGSGHEYRVVHALKGGKDRLIVPLNYPDAPDVDSPEQALDVTLGTMQHWEAAPSNAAVLEDAGIHFAFTTNGLKDAKTYRGAIRKAIKRGLSEDAALAALTLTPAKMLGYDKMLGTVDSGKSAHLVVTDGDLFAKDTKINTVWVDGSAYEINKRPEVDPRGEWTLTMPDMGQELTLNISGDIDKLKGTVSQDSTEVKLSKVVLDHRRLLVAFDASDLDVDGIMRMSADVGDGTLAGQGEWPDGRWFKWSATAASSEDEKEADDEGDASESIENVAMPSSYGAFGRIGAPDQPKHIFIQGATIWTSASMGTNKMDMLVTNGKIAKVGSGLKAPKGAVIIDGEGKHITPGLIDAHSHSGVSGSVNEFGQAVSAEVSIQDVLDPRAISLYRELAGGLTVAHVLHGSANPIGGQNATIKLRWGAAPDELLIDDATQTIKFALGENVKHSNRSDRFTTRYPQTRMGVEQIIRDRFKAALEYEREWKQYKKKKGEIPPRRDLETEALLKILRGELAVHCHSYRQDEILMLIRIADDFGFTIGSFQHVLEGYKVADAMAEHGAHASTFSDWWAYKFEVYDAIPYNGTLMHDVGVVVSFNSDSGELARRMNLEAAKAVKYGGVPEEEALKFVTINAAIQLGIDHRVGSLEAGKDGDFAVWSGSPLSTYSKCEQTWIEGRKYFDIGDDLAMRQAVAAERARLVQKIMVGDDDKSGDKGKKKMAGMGSE
jgi:imidazolonepropionase-like amidohydrolase